MSMSDFLLGLAVGDNSNEVRSAQHLASIKAREAHENKMEALGLSAQVQQKKAEAERLSGKIKGLELDKKETEKELLTTFDKNLRLNRTISALSLIFSNYRFTEKEKFDKSIMIYAMEYATTKEQKSRFFEILGDSGLFNTLYEIKRDLLLSKNKNGIMYGDGFMTKELFYYNVELNMVENPYHPFYKDLNKDFRSSEKMFSFFNKKFNEKLSFDEFRRDYQENNGEHTNPIINEVVDDSYLEKLTIEKAEKTFLSDNYTPRNNKTYKYGILKWKWKKMSK